MVEALENIQRTRHILCQSNVPEFAMKDRGKTKKFSASAKIRNTHTWYTAGHCYYRLNCGDGVDVRRLVTLPSPHLTTTYSRMLEASWNVMAHAQKQDFVFRRNGRVHLNRRGASVQSTTGSLGVRISGSNVGYTMFRGNVKSTGYPHHSPVSSSLPLPCVTVCHHISTGVYLFLRRKKRSEKIKSIKTSHAGVINTDALKTSWK